MALFTASTLPCSRARTSRIQKFNFWQDTGGMAFGSLTLVALELVAFDFSERRFVAACPRPANPTALAANGMRVEFTCPDGTARLRES